MKKLFFSLCIFSITISSFGKSKTSSSEDKTKPLGQIQTVSQSATVAETMPDGQQKSLEFDCTTLNLVVIGN